MEYIWDILDLRRSLPGGVVKAVKYQCKGIHSGSIVSTMGTVRLPKTDPTASGFIPYDDLTQTEVWGWLNAQTGSFVSSSIQEQLSNTLDLKLNPPTPTTATGLPW